MANCNMCTPGAGGTYVCGSCIKKMKAVLKRIAYPRRGTEDETMDIIDAAGIIQNIFTLEQLEC
jgi:hypothetical protein